ncbi:MAG: CRISPR-associated endonuclease Cas3'', partial [Hyphomicrobium sp.]
RVLVLLIALHDVGKFSRHFQAKSEIGWQAAVLGERKDPPAGVRHDAIGYAMLGNEDAEVAQLNGLRDVLAPDWLNSEFAALWAAVTGHHGQPALQPHSTNWHFGLRGGAREAADGFVADVVALLGPTECLPQVDNRAISLLSWTVAGLTVISDWIGSSETWFRYTQPHYSLAEYWNGTSDLPGARAQADKALTASGILSVDVASMKSLDDAKRLLPSIMNLSPLQELALQHPLPIGPTLVIVEDVTGSGKTEAALLLSARMMADGRADGLFFALPTMATANVMYERLSVSYRQLFADDVEASLVLAHGRRALHPGFTRSILADASAQPDHAIAETAADETATAACAAWIADDRRKAFLAHVGIGTIDQAVLGVLPSRHQSLRLWGLADRVLVIDEAHSYDCLLYT